MIEIRIHGRGGQGAVTSAELLALAAFKDKKYAQSFPMFGVERRGAPVEAFCRIDKEKIMERSQIYEPDYVLVLDSTLLKSVDVTKGLKKSGLLVINSKQDVSKLNLNFEIGKIISIDLNSIALNIIGRPIVNTAMLGAFAGITNIITLKSLTEAIQERFDEKIAIKNKELAEKSYEIARKFVLGMKKNEIQ
ncbi:MAG: pyruvate ferredoxin oxidoreductase subunit gamma [Candidatus Parvarchaeota archaeon]|nr:pyruvate ferredoxin oxidoreductase subunit gamma [Candidatus Jingweiarchaeum tengchongense]MCW1298005.1 pyruvate ferredoxin oxidoreductase subunit gamma [Candidatus Jingweiarchaeum tengchongense]MCW1300194.1 pyruvate ferredoxin oxidoreductase subunit gamma [Candidatus Jingweiarchaeum tengchongense]MCW1304404.1 pyruvate ferredoxin oxidoreductase subunit gamma [Candidatus Jingweiarchaeum tengchongense]MCW1305955.1 pyruvate ferredoxin oxidoreductase subunit gamma [Candidatus Jingweiarchaeum ten